MKLSIVLAVYNEEKNLAECLKSVEHIADEIVIVDGGSTDNTVEIAQKFGARVIKTTNPPMFHINKQKALEAAKGDWILHLDADERVAPALAKQIQEAVKGYPIEIVDAKKQNLFIRHQQNIEARDGKIGTDKSEITAYFIPRLNFFLGGYLKHGGVYPDGEIRLVKKGKAYFPCKNVHEQMHIDGRVAWLSEDLIHMADPTFSRYLMRANRYTSLTAKEFEKQHIPKFGISVFMYMFVKPFTTFLSLYFRHKGFLDGFPGFVWAVFSGLHFPLAYMKYWENHDA